MNTRGRRRVEVLGQTSTPGIDRPVVRASALRRHPRTAREPSLPAPSRCLRHAQARTLTIVLAGLGDDPIEQGETGSGRLPGRCSAQCAERNLEWSCYSVTMVRCSCGYPATCSMAFLADVIKLGEQAPGIAMCNSCSDAVLVENRRRVRNLRRRVRYRQRKNESQARR